MRTTFMHPSLYSFDTGSLQTLTPVLTTSGTFSMNNDVKSFGSYTQNGNSTVNFAVSPEVANPMPIRKAQFYVLESTEEKFTHDLREAYKHARYYSSDELAGYGEELLETGKSFASNPIDLLIVPYRGGLSPSLQLQVINKMSYPTIPLGFSRGSQEEHWPEIRDELVHQFEAFRGRPALAIGVIDTAIRGDSSLGLANVIQQAKNEFKGQPWNVTFHLLHACDRHNTPTLAHGIPHLSRGDLIFDLRFHEVPSLLVDDWDEGMGLQAEWKEGRCIYKATSEGQIIVRQPDGSVALLESQEINRVFDEILSQVVTETMVTDPTLILRPPQSTS